MTAGGLGLRVMCSMNTLAVLPAAGQECTLYTFMNVREDAMELFGFCQKEERDDVQAPDLRKRHRPKERAGRAGQHAAGGSAPGHPHRGRRSAVPRAPGIGKKTAQRISLELKDKLAQDALSGAAGLDDAAFAIEPDAPAQDALGEALLALKSLGYTPQEAAAALKGVKGQAETPDELIKLALRHMAQNM